MKFIKGVMIGGIITTGLVMMYSETGMLDKKTVMKKGKKLAKKWELCRNGQIGKAPCLTFNYVMVAIL